MWPKSCNLLMISWMISWMRINSLVFPVLDSIQRSFSFKSCWKVCTAMTTSSVCTVLTRSKLQLLEVCLAWRNNPWLASSRTIGVNSSQSILWIHSTSLMQVATKTRLNWIIAIVELASRRNSSFLFSSQRKIIFNS